jgi:hypothetical protein
MQFFEKLHLILRDSTYKIDHTLNFNLWPKIMLHGFFVWSLEIGAMGQEIICDE